MTVPTTSVDAPAGTDARQGARADVAAADCPLCGEAVLADELRAHVQTDRDEIRRYVLSVIRTSNPEWVESDGSCAKCWEYYRNL